MKTNSGRVSSGYQFISWKAALKGISTPPSPHSSNAAAASDEADHSEHENPPLPGQQQQHHG
jgi:hypothetical protein